MMTEKLQQLAMACDGKVIVKINDHRQGYGQEGAMRNWAEQTCAGVPVLLLTEEMIKTDNCVCLEFYPSRTGKCGEPNEGFISLSHDLETALDKALATVEKEKSR